MTQYRIIIETERSGKKWYYIQKRWLLYFWRFFYEIRDIGMKTYRTGWNTLEEAELHIQYQVNQEYNKSQEKIIKREILKC